ncbi:MAG: transketolase [Candidatus Odinarchaeota archaeon]
MERDEVTVLNDEPDFDFLENKTLVIRRQILEMISSVGSGHPGGSLSCVEILTTLYFHTMNIDPDRPRWNDRDRFVLSKGHAAPALYATLAEKGFFSLKDQKPLRSIGSNLQGHPDRHRLPGIDASTGSLGNGLSIGLGIALAGKLNDQNYKTYVLLGDGECNEGLIWEAAMAASHHKAENLIAVIDRNGLQIDGPTEQVMGLEPLARKWESFGWHVLQVDGHDMKALISAFEQAKQHRHQPSVIIAHLIKGSGVSYMEWVASFHGKPPNHEELTSALQELSKGYK